MRDEVIELPNVDAPVQVDLDVAGSGPQLEFGIEVEHSSRVLRRPHIDCVVRQGVDLHLLAREPLRVPHDESLGGEDRRVAERLICGDRLLALDKQWPNIVWNRAFGDERPRGNIGDSRGQSRSDLLAAVVHE